MQRSLHARALCNALIIEDDSLLKRRQFVTVLRATEIYSFRLEARFSSTRNILVLGIYRHVTT
jgi:hypothetical protein